MRRHVYQSSEEMEYQRKLIKLYAQACSAYPDFRRDEFYKYMARSQLLHKVGAAIAEVKYHTDSSESPIDMIYSILNPNETIRADLEIARIKRMQLLEKLRKAHQENEKLQKELSTTESVPSLLVILKPKSKKKNRNPVNFSIATPIEPKFTKRRTMMSHN